MPQYWKTKTLYPIKHQIIDSLRKYRDKCVAYVTNKHIITNHLCLAIESLDFHVKYYIHILLSESSDCKYSETVVFIAI